MTNFTFTIYVCRCSLSGCLFIPWRPSRMLVVLSSHPSHPFIHSHSHSFSRVSVRNHYLLYTPESCKTDGVYIQAKIVMALSNVFKVVIVMQLILANPVVYCVCVCLSVWLHWLCIPFALSFRRNNNNDNKWVKMRLQKWKSIRIVVTFQHTISIPIAIAILFSSSLSLSSWFSLSLFLSIFIMVWLRMVSQ